MKKWICLVFLLLALTGEARAAELPGDLTEALPEAAEDVLDVDDLSGPGGFSQGLAGIAERLSGEVKSVLRQRLRGAASILLVAVACGAVDGFARGTGEGKAAAFLSVEGAELLGCDPARLEEAAAEGVVAINLTWNHANALSGSHCDEPERGLSPLGRQFVEKMEDLHILVDVSHLSEAGFWDVAELARRPILASHSNAKSVWDHTRNLTDGQINAIIKNQGVIGLNFYEEFVGRTRDLAALRAHLDHILSLGGASNVALGGDWDGCDTIAALPSIDRLGDFYEYLLCHGYHETVVRDLFYNNLMRVVRQR